MAGVAVVRSSSSVKFVGDAVCSSKLLSILGMASLAEWDYMPRQAAAVPGGLLLSRTVLSSARLLETGEMRTPDSVDESEFEKSSGNSFDLRFGILLESPCLLSSPVFSCTVISTVATIPGVQANFV